VAANEKAQERLRILPRLSHARKLELEAASRGGHVRVAPLALPSTPHTRRLCPIPGLLRAFPGLFLGVGTPYGSTGNLWAASVTCLKRPTLDFSAFQSHLCPDQQSCAAKNARLLLSGFIRCIPVIPPPSSRYSLGLLLF
jgi:hypothetical protein